MNTEQIVTPPSAARYELRFQSLFHSGRGLTFVGRPLHETDERRNGVEEAAGAGGYRRVDATVQHCRQRMALSFGESRNGREVSHCAPVSAEGCVKCSNRRAARLARGHVACP